MKRLLLLWSAVIVSACARPADVAVANPAAVNMPPAHYERPEMWLCRPDLPTDVCRGDLDATELRRDGSRVVVPFVPATMPNVDCFYVYPTVDMAMVPGNHTDFTDTTRMRDATRAQAARFGAACRVIAPLYRQITFDTYLVPREEREPRLKAAFADVLDAFRWYLAHLNEGRRIVLIGHSQGAEMVVRLLLALFDGDARMRARLLVAMPIGGDVQVEEGSATGGTFRNIPLCTSVEELGCIVAFNTFLPEGVARPWPDPSGAGRRTACVNPADVGGAAKHQLSGAAFLVTSPFTGAVFAYTGATTPFVVLRDFYSVWCVDRADGRRYLAVEATPGPGDVRESPVDLSRSIWRSRLGLHVLDVQFAQEDLVHLVEQKAAIAGRQKLP
jgi:pimeloyl-ACP methyl ester carboxylesterase